jgi:galactose mutarotase-like enzyme
MAYILTNRELTIGINSFGAELTSICCNRTGSEYLWQADPVFWKRHSPILFPIVGSLWNGEYHYKETAYPMSQHGFARDNEFELIYQSDTEIRFRLTDNKETQKVYPFRFELQIGYKLTNNRLEVIWQVINKGEADMYFQIGAHPAFFYPDFDPENDSRGYFAFDKKENINYILIEEKGCANTDIKYPLQLNREGLLPIDIHTFDRDALIIQDDQIHRVSLLDILRRPYVTLEFDAPLVGLWSPPSKRDCPFVCIEPWYGRCDRVGYVGDMSERDYMNRLPAGKIFDASYTIIIEMNK